VGAARWARSTKRVDSAQTFADALDAASRGEIDSELRARAERLIAKHPWGSALHAPAQSSS
jgi:hypothetical protein